MTEFRILGYLFDLMIAIFYQNGKLSKILYVRS